MGNLKSFHDHLRNSQSQAKKLTEAGPALNALFATEGTRLNREDEASRLRAMYDSIVEQLQRLRQIEASSSRSHSQANLMLSLVEVAVTAMVSKGRRLSAITDCLLRGPTTRKQSFGLVMVCIGPAGLPDDVGVISISQLARESGRPQPEVINKLQEKGSLLFDEEAFAILTDGLVDHVREGKLHLPVSRDKLVETMEPHNQKLGLRITRLE